MPELPEVETVMRGMKPHLTKQKITAFDIYSPALRIPIQKQKIQKLKNIKIVSLTRRAKYILIHFENHKTLVIHLGMTGSFTVYLSPQHKNIMLDRHDHVVITTDKNTKLVFRDPRRFGLIDVVNTDEINTHKLFLHLGCEPLESVFTAEALKEKLHMRRIAIKPAIMDQSVVVGVGNIYASEALYLSGIHPETPASDVSFQKLSILVEKIKYILGAAIESGGSTLRDYRQVGGEVGNFQFNFSVYDREGEACPVCDCSIGKTGGIQRIVQAGRSTFFCPTQQKE